MEGRKIFIFIMVIFVIGAFVGKAIGGAPLPGSKEDPLVTKSYVDKLVRERFGPLSKDTDGLENSVTNLAFRVERLQAALERPEVVLTIDSKTACIGDSSYLLDVAPFIENGRTLVPFRFVGEALGAEVGWIAEERTVTYNLNGTTVKMKIGSNKIEVNGDIFLLDVPARVINGRTVVPVRMVSEVLGAEVGWDGKERKVTICSR